MGPRVFTCDWVTERADAMGAALVHLRGRAGVRMLEIGSWEGRSALWFLDNILTGPDCRLTCVDPWTYREPRPHVEANFDANTLEARRAGLIVKVRARSDVIDTWPAGGYFDAVYVDGDHSAAAVLADAWRAWRQVKPGGVVLFDDYSAAAYPGVVRAVDEFLGKAPGVEFVRRGGYQVAVRRLY